MSQDSLDKPTLGALYRQMLRIRLAEERISEIYPSDKIQSPVHLSIGQEAVAAGVCMAMKENVDRIYGTYRGHGIYIAKGGDLGKLMAELYAKETGCSGGKGGSMHLIAREVGLMGCSAIVASTIPMAGGDALASQMRGEDRVVVAFFGDGAMGEGVVYESMNFAVLKNLPVLFVCENNNYAVHTPIETRHKYTELYKYGEGMGIKGARFDGDDVTVAFQETSNALERLRKGGAPEFIELMTYRWYEHVGPGKDHKEVYRNKEKLKHALENDPIDRAKSILQKEHQVDDKELQQWKDEVLKEVEEAVEFAEKSPFPSEKSLYDGLYEVKE